MENESVLIGKVMALETLVELLWAHELSKEDDPVKEAQDFKTETLDLVLFDPEVPNQAEAVHQLNERFDFILERVKSL